jgi:eukaryotic-like serine/threonine-protein kinase
VRSLGDSDPRQVGPYRLLAELDADEMGLVLLGRAPDGRLAAVKLVSARLTADGGFPQRLAGEVAASRRLPGVHTAPVVDAGMAHTSLWLASEFPPGLSMRQMIERGVLLGEDALLRLAAGLAGALTEIHRAGLVHRDLTLVNVRLTEDGVRVLDFGVARAVDHDVGLAVGSPEFMSPEQASGQPVTPAGDVFSLGAVLHLAATGRSLFAGATRAETLAHVVAAQPDLSPSLPTRVRQLMAACLAKDPRQRPTTDQLRAMIGPVPPAAHPWPPMVRAMIAEEHTEIARLLGNTFGLGQPDVDAPTTHITPVAVPRRTARPRRPERWKPDMWAVGSGAAVVVTIVFAVIMFNALTPDRPIRASQQGSSTADPTATESVVPTTTTTTTTTTTQQAPSGQLTGLAGKCADIAGANAASGTPVQLHQCNGTDAQQWVFSLDGTVQGLGKCLEVSGGATNDGATVQISDCNGSVAQRWAATSEGWIINVQANKCLDVPGANTNDGTQLIIWTCHGQVNQVWTPPA